MKFAFTAVLILLIIALSAFCFRQNNEIIANRKIINEIEQEKSILNDKIRQFDFDENSIVGEWTGEPKPGVRVVLNFDSSGNMTWGYDGIKEAVTTSGKFRVTVEKPYNKVNIYDLSINNTGKMAQLFGIFLRPAKDTMVFYGRPSSEASTYPKKFGEDTIVLHRSSGKEAK